MGCKLSAMLGMTRWMYIHSRWRDLNSPQRAVWGKGWVALVRSVMAEYFKVRVSLTYQNSKIKNYKH